MVRGAGYPVNQDMSFPEVIGLVQPQAGCSSEPYPVSLPVARGLVSG